MTLETTKILRDALALAPEHRAAIAEELLASLDRPDARIDALWAAEAEDRLAAYQAGEIEAVPAEEVIAELDEA